VIVLTGAMGNHDKPDCRPACRWIRPCHLVLCDERVFVVVSDESLNFPCLWRTNDEFNPELLESKSEMDAVEATIKVDTVDLDVFPRLRDELAECVRQLVGTVTV
jgi:hypothetical protein